MSELSYLHKERSAIYSTLLPPSICLFRVWYSKNDFEFVALYPICLPLTELSADTSTLKPCVLLGRRTHSFLYYACGDYKIVESISLWLAEVNIARHLADLGIEEEFGNHAHIRGLSGGQKVKCVLAACTWLSPHIIVLVSPASHSSHRMMPIVLWLYCHGQYRSSGSFCFWCVGCVHGPWKQTWSEALRITAPWHSKFGRWSPRSLILKICCLLYNEPPWHLFGAWSSYVCCCLMICRLL